MSFRAIISAVSKLITYIRKDPILIVSGILAAISCFIVPPDNEYPGYMNFKVLAILMSLMLVVAILLRIGTFDYLTDKLLGRTDSSRTVSLLITLLSFFMAMFLTNDVALVTLVPFGIAALKPFNDRRSMMFTLILMTVAANLGSMLTPIGNPQNLYLYNHYDMKPLAFIKLMLPYSALSLALIITALFILVKNKKTENTADIRSGKPHTGKLLICLALFIVCILAVAQIINWILMFAIVIAAALILDRKAFKYVDYHLLITFVFFFILTGNLGRIDIVYDTISRIVSVSPVLTAVAASQIISNVPAAMLLSTFTEDGTALIIGTNLGGLGTLIASMASLITYRFYTSLDHGTLKGSRTIGYLPAFTIINVLFLAVLLLFWRMIL